MNTNTPAPPRWPLRLLRLFLRKQYVEEIEGDMEELFHDNLERYPLRTANRLYTWEVLKLLRPILMKQLFGFKAVRRQGMLNNYFKVSVRGLARNPVNSFINISGLAVAIGGCVMAYAFTRWTYSIDQFHEHKNEVFLTTFFADRDGGSHQYGRTPRPLGEMMRQDFPQILNVCRVEDVQVVMKYRDAVYEERIRFTDPDFLEMLTFPMKWGNAASLEDPNSMILSEEMSIKYFGDENPLGQSIFVRFDKERGKEFKITGVARKFPRALTVRFHFLAHIDNLEYAEPGYDVHEWSALNHATLIRVRDASDISSIGTRMDKYRVLQNAAVAEDWKITRFGFEPLATLHITSADIKDDISFDAGDNYKSVMFLAILAAFLLALGCLNYINIAIVSAAKRLKEIGVRKTIGATRRIVIVQFLSENVVITFFALLIGLLIGMFVFIPGFEYMNDFSMDFRLMDPWLWIFLPAVLLVTSVASGIYPAVYISRFQVVGILKGATRFGSRNPLTRIFLSIQLALACVFITSAVVFTRNSIYLANRSWGYDQSDLLYAQVPDRQSFEQLSAAMSRDAAVLSVSGSVHHLGRTNGRAVVSLPDHRYEVDRYDVEPSYFKTMGLPLKTGRYFHEQDNSDRRSVIVNETLARNLGWSDAVGKTFRMDSLQYEVVGVVTDVHSYSFFTRIAPMLFRVADQEDCRFLSLRVSDGSQVEAYKKLQQKWSELFPDVPFSGGFQEDVWGGYYQEIENHGTVWRVVATIAVLVASMGLYGLMSLNVAGRAREFSVRKVMGAGLTNITASVSKQYVLLFAAGIVVGAPLSYVLINGLIEMAYRYHMPLGMSGVLTAIGILTVVVVLTLSTQVSSVWRSSPVKGLKVE